MESLFPVATTDIPVALHTGWMADAVARDAQRKLKREAQHEQELRHAELLRKEALRRVNFTRVATPGRPWVALKAARPFLYDAEQGVLDRSVNTLPPPLRVKQNGILDMPSVLLPYQMREPLQDYDSLQFSRDNATRKRKMLQEVKVAAPAIRQTKIAATPMWNTERLRLQAKKTKQQEQDLMQLPLLHKTAKKSYAKTTNSSSSSSKSAKKKAKTGKESTTKQNKANMDIEGKEKEEKEEEEENKRDTPTSKKRKQPSSSDSLSASSPGNSNNKRFKASQSTFTVKPGMSRVKQIAELSGKIDIHALPGENDVEEIGSSSVSASSDDDVDALDEEQHEPNLRRRGRSVINGEIHNRAVATLEDKEFKRQVARLMQMDEDGQRAEVKAALGISEDEDSDERDLRRSGRKRKPTLVQTEVRVQLIMDGKRNALGTREYKRQVLGLGQSEEPGSRHHEMRMKEKKGDYEDDSDDRRDNKSDQKEDDESEEEEERLARREPDEEGWDSSSEDGAADELSMTLDDLVAALS